MSSEQFTARPQGDRPALCAECGAEILTPSARTCWLCQAELVPVVHAAQPLTLRYTRQALGDNLVMAILGGLALVYSVFIAISAPGMLAVLAVLAAPAIIRTVVMATKSTRRKDWSAAGTFFASIGVMAVVGHIAGIAGAIAFCAVCLAEVVATGSSGNSFEQILRTSLIVGGLFGLVVFVLLSWLFWRNPDRAV